MNHSASFAAAGWRRLSQLGWACFFLLAGLVSGSAAPAAPTRPNIILLLTDDMGWGDLGCYGGTFVPTPNIDRMAAEGTRLTQYYAASPICSPSRAGIITGQYPAKWRLTSFLQARAGNRQCEQADFLDPQAPSLPRALKEAGYATGHFGKWHLGGGRDVTNAPKFAAYGYDENASTYESPEPHPDITATNWIWSADDKVKRWDRTAFFVDKTLDFLKRHPGQPCFVNLWPDDVHTPWVPSDEDMREGNNRDEAEDRFKKVLAEYDRQVGRLFAGLKELGIDTNTLVIFTADNGALPTFGGARSGHLRGSKMSLYEGGTREPFIVRWPGHTPAGRVDDKSIFTGLDLLPSFCALAGVEVSRKSTDGEDLSALFEGKKASRRQPTFWEYGRNQVSFRYPPKPDRSPNVAVRDGRWKLLINADGTGVQLYDLEKDPRETTNLAGQRPAETKRLTQAALNWRSSLP